MKDPINFSIGLPDFDVPEVAKEAAIAAIHAGQNRYTQTQGIAPLRERLRKDLSAEIGKDVGDILITSGVSGGLLLAILATVNPGDEVVFLDPYFVMYKHLVTMAGGKSVIVDSYPDFRFPADRVDAAITPRTKLLILNSPSNPTGVVMTEADIRSAVAVARKHDVLILSDEIYEPFLYDIGTSNEFIQPRRFVRQDDSASRLFQEPRNDGLAARLRGRARGDHFADDQVAAVHVCLPAVAVSIRGVEGAGRADGIRRDGVSPQARHGLRGLSRQFEIVKPQGAFYIFPKAPAAMTASEFVTRAIDNNVLIIPGNVFSERDTHFRISYATTDEKIKQGIDILCSLVSSRTVDET